MELGYPVHHTCRPRLTQSRHCQIQVVGWASMLLSPSGYSKLPDFLPLPVGVAVRRWSVVLRCSNPFARPVDLDPLSFRQNPENARNPTTVLPCCNCRDLTQCDYLSTLSKYRDGNYSIAIPVYAVFTATNSTVYIRHGQQSHTEPGCIHRLRR